MGKRIFLKISGEMFSGGEPISFTQQTIQSYAKQIKDLHDKNFQIALGVGGGNIIRGREISHNVGRIYGDYIGVLGTVMNGLYLKSVLEKMNLPARLYSAVVVPEIAERFEPIKSEHYLKDGQILIFAGGITRTRFTSDTNSAISCIETSCDLFLKGTKVDGIYENDPVKNPDAKRFKTISYQQCINDPSRYAFMDTTALVLLNNDKVETRIFSVKNPENIIKAASNDKGIGTLITSQNKIEFY